THAYLPVALFSLNVTSTPDFYTFPYTTLFRSMINLSENVQSIIAHHNISTRSSLYIQRAKEEGFIEEENIEYIAGTTMLIWTGMLTNMLNLRKEYSKEEAARRTMRYVYKSIMYTVTPEKRDQVKYDVSYFDE